MAEDDRAELRFAGLEGEHAEVERALRYFGANLPRRDAADVHVHERVRLAKAGDERQHHVHRRFVCANQHAPPAKVALALARRTTDSSLPSARRRAQPPLTFSIFACSSAGPVKR